MDDLTRRRALHKTASLGMIAAVVPAGEAEAVDEPVPAKAAEGDLDRRCVIGSGMTEAEADCWALAAQLAGKFFELPELHPMDKQEIATAIHVIQHRLLSRPTYRKYRTLHEAESKKG